MPSLPHLILDRPCNVEEPRTDPQSSLASRPDIYVEPNAPVFDSQSDHAALPEESVTFADGEHSGGNFAQNPSDIPFRSADEQYLAARCSYSGKPADNDRTILYTLAFDDLIEGAPERVLAENTNREVSAASRARRPRDELGEIQQVGCLDLVLGCLRHSTGILRLTDRPKYGYGRRKEHHDEANAA
jgi:hypothetical protein